MYWDFGFSGIQVLRISGIEMAAVIEPRDVPALSTVVKDPDFVATPTCTITSKKDPSHPMRAVEFHGKQDMKVKIRPRPMLTDPVSNRYCSLITSAMDR